MRTLVKQTVIAFHQDGSKIQVLAVPMIFDAHHLLGQRLVSVNWKELLRKKVNKHTPEIVKLAYYPFRDAFR